MSFYMRLLSKFLLQISFFCRCIKEIKSSNVSSNICPLSLAGIPVSPLILCSCICFTILPSFLFPLLPLLLSHFLLLMCRRKKVQRLQKKKRTELALIFVEIKSENSSTENNQKENQGHKSFVGMLLSFKIPDIADTKSFFLAPELQP